MLTKHISALTLLSMFIFQGCASVYVPNAHHIHMMENEGEIHIAGGYGNNGLNMQGGFSITNFLGIVGAYSEKDFAIFDSDERKIQYYEGGINFFRPIGINGKIEVVAGMGRGTGEIDQPLTRVESGEFEKRFVQVSAAIMPINTEAGVSLRFADVNFVEFESTKNIDGLKRESLFIEPAAFVSMGSKNVKLESQLGYSFSITNPSDLAFDYEFIRLTVGVRFIFNR